MSHQTHDHMAYQCALCEMWQIEYSVSELMKDFGAVTIENGVLRGDPIAMYEAIDDVVEEHLRHYHPLAVGEFQRKRGQR